MTRPRLSWKTVDVDEGAVAHDNQWPLLEELITRDPSATVDHGRKAREAALRALVHTAFVEGKV